MTSHWRTWRLNFDQSFWYICKLCDLHWSKHCDTSYLQLMDCSGQCNPGFVSHPFWGSPSESINISIDFYTETRTKYHPLHVVHIYTWTRVWEVSSRMLNDMSRLQLTSWFTEISYHFDEWLSSNCFIHYIPHTILISINH